MVKTHLPLGAQEDYYLGTATSVARSFEDTQAPGSTRPKQYLPPEILLLPATIHITNAFRETNKDRKSLNSIQRLKDNDMGSETHYEVQLQAGSTSGGFDGSSHGACEDEEVIDGDSFPGPSPMKMTTIGIATRDFGN